MATFLTIKEKFFAFLEEMGIKKVDFYEATGIQSSNFKGANLKSAPGSDMLVKILTIYPNLSAEWLLRDEGSMLRDGATHKKPGHNTPKEKNEEQQEQLPPDILQRMIDDRDNKIGDLREDIGRLKERIAQLEREKNVSLESLQTAPKELSPSTLDL